MRRSRGPSQLSRGLGDALGDLGELQAGALGQAGLTAALVRTDGVAAALAVQLVVLRACRDGAGGGRLRGPGQGLPGPLGLLPLPTHCHRPTRAGLGPRHSPTWNEVLLFGWGREAETP